MSISTGFSINNAICLARIYKIAGYEILNSPKNPIITDFFVDTSTHL